MKLIPLTRGKFAIVDDEDHEWLSAFSWYAIKSPVGTWYAKRGVRIGPRKLNKVAHIGMHQVLLFGGSYIDHINTNGLDNRKSNLRFTDGSGNRMNTIKISTKTSSCYKGVTWHDPSWQARIKINGESIYLGSFRCERSAAQAYDDAARKHFEEFARPNIYA